jgi:tetratricopeptide (TPR) repeat protein
MNQILLRSLGRGFSVATLLLFGTIAAAQTKPLDAGISDLQYEWEVIQYRTPANERADKFAALATKAEDLSAEFPQRAEPHVWVGIVLSSWAGARGGLGALGTAKKAKSELEAAIQIDPSTLDGSALESLGVLFYKVPGWPVGFGDKDQAETLLKRALAVNPTGIDANYFYGDYLVSLKRYSDSVPYLKQAVNAPPRPGREIADAGRREEAKSLLARSESADK